MPKAENTEQMPKTTKASFVIHVEYQENATWQGTLTWTNTKKTAHFRSALEMIKLIDSAMQGPDNQEYG